MFGSSMDLLVVGDVFADVVPVMGDGGFGGLPATDVETSGFDDELAGAAIVLLVRLAEVVDDAKQKDGELPSDEVAFGGSLVDEDGANLHVNG